MTFGGEDTDNDSGRWTTGGMPSVLKLGLAECTLSLVSRSAISIGYFGPSIIPIVITKQPPANVAVAAGQPLTLKVIATGFPLHYQWSLNGTDITGATSATYTVPSASAADTGTYTVRLSNVYQSDVISTPSVVTLATQPTGLAIHLDGTVPVVTWTSGVLQQAGEVTGTWGDVSGATSPYTVPAGSAHKFYRLRNTN